MASLAFPKYISSKVEPCAIASDGRSLPFHLLACGHMVAVDSLDSRCGLNCLHVSTWMTRQLSYQGEGSMQLNTGKTLYHSLTFSGGRPHRPIKPPQTNTQGHDQLFCEICQGIPLASYNIARPNHGFRRALGLTRAVLGHFTSFPPIILSYFLCSLLHDPLPPRVMHECTHNLLCGHEVWCEQSRPCASNCRDMPPCHNRVFPNNVKQGDAILCKECTYRAELVYERYINAGGGGAQEEVARHGLSADRDQKSHGNAIISNQRTFKEFGSSYEQHQSPGVLDPQEPLKQDQRHLVPESQSFSNPSDFSVQSVDVNTKSHTEGDSADIPLGDANAMDCIIRNN